MTAAALLSHAVLERLISLREPASRHEIATMYRELGQLPAPISAETIRRLIQIDDIIARALASDIRWFFNDMHDPETAVFARDIAMTAGLQAGAHADLLARRGEWSLDESDPLLARMAVKCGQSFVHAVKWSLMQAAPVQPVKATLWPPMYRLFALSEKLPAPAAGEVAALVLRALTMDLIATMNPASSEIEIADAWLGAWTPAYTIDTAFNPARHRLGFDLDSMAGFQLARPNAGARWRYVDATKQRDQLHLLHAEHTAGRIFGEGLEGFTIEQHAGLASKLEKLNAAMFDTSGGSLEARETVENREAEVVFGFQAILAALRGEAPVPSSADTGSTATRMSLSLEPLTGQHAAVSPAGSTAGYARWSVLDISSRGIGLRGKLAADDTGSEHGALVLARTCIPASALHMDATTDAAPDGESVSAWMLAQIARWVESPPEGVTRQVRMGAEVVGRRMKVLQVTRIGGGTEEISIFDPTVATSVESSNASMLDVIYIAGQADDGHDDALIFDSGRLGTTRSVLLQAGEQQHTLKLTRILRRGAGWVSCRFHVVEPAGQ